jgi:hypothetical protein
MSLDKNPWASGPGEILNHGLNLLKKRDSDVNRRIAMIIIDNSVELMIKTFLNLPKRITGINISRAKYAEFSESFPKLLDALEEYALDKVPELHFGEIEWYHRLRNELYHQGNGLTVERQKVVTYASIAKILFKNLYGFDLLEKEVSKDELDLERYLELWGQFELIIQSRKFNSKPFDKSTIEILKELENKKYLDKEDLKIIAEYRNYRNKIVHSQMKVDDIPLPLKENYIPYMKSIMTKIKGFEI